MLYNCDLCNCRYSEYRNHCDDCDKNFCDKCYILLFECPICECEDIIAKYSHTKIYRISKILKLYSLADFDDVLRSPHAVKEYEMRIKFEFNTSK